MSSAITPMVAQPIQLGCPRCQHVFQSQVTTLLDVSEQPELKKALLSGQLNVAVCPNCSTATMIATPLTYHDADKQACMVYIPTELNLSLEEQERFIGSSTSTITQNLPPQAPRGYLLTPKRFMSIESLADAILEADGIPREAVEQQRHYVNLISALAEALDDETHLARLVEQHRNELNQEFFAILGAFIETSIQENQPASAQLLSTLRQKLAHLTGVEEASGSGAAVPPAELEKVFEQLEQAPEEQIEEILAEVRPMIDYAFFQTWTARIHTIEKEGREDEAQRLAARRTRVAETVERMDREAYSLIEESSRVLHSVLEAPDMAAALREQNDKVNEAFMMVLSANLESARKEGREDVVARLEELTQVAVDIIQSNLPPEERLINELLMAPTPEQITTILQKNSEMVTTEFVKKLNELSQEQEKWGNADIASRLRHIARQAGSLVY